MNFSNVIKNEILGKFNKDIHCKKAFLAGYIRGLGLIVEYDGVLGLEVKANSTKVENIIIEHFVSIYKLSTDDIQVFSRGKEDKCIIGIYNDNVIKVLSDLEVFTLLNGEYQVNFNMFEGNITKKDCCLRAFFRGLFLACGNCTIPSQQNNANTGYHLQIVFSHSVPAEVTARQLYKFNIEAKITRRKENYVVYLKSAEHIKDFIAFLPAPVSVLNIMDLMINREISNKSNRQKNCDLGNLNRQVEASLKQVEAIKKLVSSGVLDNLKTDLKETAIARLDYPDETLIELAERLNISKSCLNHRLRKLVGLSNQI